MWREQVAVVTGGAGGLGWLMAKLLELKGAEVVVWDVREPDERAEADEGGVKWMGVDVGDVDAVEKAYKRVCDEVCRFFLFCSVYSISTTLSSDLQVIIRLHHMGEREICSISVLT